MKKIGIALFSGITLILISWGFTGHQTVGVIAERHLSPKAKQAVRELLNGQSLSDVASWADEVRNQPEYKYTAPWHFLNLPLGLNEGEFEQSVKNQTKENVYTAIIEQEKILESNTSSIEQKTIALKFLTHFIGDATQPMHISRAEDKGGNTIQVRFDDKGTNLHSLWDSKLIDHQGLSSTQLADKIDTVKLKEITSIDKMDIMSLLFTSYKESSKLYKEAEQNNKLDEDYYKSHIDIVNARLEIAGVKLASILNHIFKNYHSSNSTQITPKSNDEAKPGPMPETSLKDVEKHIGEVVLIQGIIYDYKDFVI